MDANQSLSVGSLSFKLMDSLAILGSVGILYYVWKRSRTALLVAPQYPPGPTPSFFTGNLRDLPSGGDEWVQYRDLSRKHGSDVIHLNIFGSHMVVLNSERAANDLLDHKGSIYSCRPRMVMLKELMGWDWSVVVMPYGETFLAHRRIIQQEFQPRMVASTYQSIIARECRMLLANLLRAPDNFVHHLKSLAAATIMMIAYGHQVNPEGDEYVKLAEEVRASGAGPPGSHLVDVLPALKYIPEWFPGAYFKRHARWGKGLIRRMRHEPNQMVKQKMATGDATPCMTSRLVETLSSTGGIGTDELIMNCTGAIYSAAADTTVTALTTFILVMIMHPGIQQKARAEIDSVVGRDRLPEFSDRVSTPYMNCIVKEILRWKPVTPLGVPHSTTENDIYRGMFIPKKATVVPNLWAMLHDPEVYYDPEEFIPERFMPNETRHACPDPFRVVWGFGRRICPGRHLADASLWMAMISLLWAFDFKKPNDPQGNVIEPNVIYGSDVVSVPSKFSCQILPRSHDVVSLINDFD
ncbi:cytochrome P450 [Gyrodon lividus]|nr:cytochrome P450 [Gyrodon lividus]